jgi:uncharacterized protein YcbK (DUF882 family)
MIMTLKEARRAWDAKRWPNFKPDEVACRCCGEVCLLPREMDMMQALRDHIGEPLRIVSAHRCRIHNARVGGAPLSSHLGLAFDISLIGKDRKGLRDAAKSFGFTGFGYYTSFLHIDTGRQRFWYGSKQARKIWL